MTIMKSAEYSERNEILLGDSFTRAKNLYTSLDPAAQRSTLKTLKAKRNRLWCRVILYIPVCCFVWHALPCLDNDSLCSKISVFVMMFGVFFIPMFGMYIVLLAVFSIFVTLRVKHLRTLSNDEVSEVSDVQKRPILDTTHAAGATVTEVAQALNVSRATVYRHANP